jgi:hypothetical protein
MRSPNRSEPLDLDKGLPADAKDVAALRRLRESRPSLTSEQYFRFLAALPQPSAEDLRRRRGPRGEPFAL